MPRRPGYGTQPRVSTLGIVHQERRALNGRQIERPNKAEAGADRPVVARPNCALRLLRGNRCELHPVSASRPFRVREMQDEKD